MKHKVKIHPNNREDALTFITREFMREDVARFIPHPELRLKAVRKVVYKFLKTQRKAIVNSQDEGDRNYHKILGEIQRSVPQVTLEQVLAKEEEWLKIQQMEADAEILEAKEEV